jgi:hypothetical protein
MIGGQYGDALEALKTGRHDDVDTGESLGFDAIVKSSGDSYIVQAGSFSVQENAQRLADRLKAAGFDAIIK